MPTNAMKNESDVTTRRTPDTPVLRDWVMVSPCLWVFENGLESAEPREQVSRQLRRIAKVPHETRIARVRGKPRHIARVLRHNPAVCKSYMAVWGSNALTRISQLTRVNRIPLVRLIARP